MLSPSITLPVFPKSDKTAGGNDPNTFAEPRIWIPYLPVFAVIWVGLVVKPILPLKTYWPAPRFASPPIAWRTNCFTWIEPADEKFWQSLIVSLRLTPITDWMEIFPLSTVFTPACKTKSDPSVLLAKLSCNWIWPPTVIFPFWAWMLNSLANGADVADGRNIFPAMETYKALIMSPNR